MKYYGYAGNILYVDLTTGSVKKEPLDIEMARQFIGGSGLNFKLAYDTIKPGTDPLSPDNPVIIGVGPLVGTLAPAASKVCVTTKFALPATEDGRNYIASAISGSRRFGLMLKNAGYDNIVITGAAKTPVYLKIIDDDVEICDASDLWQKKDIYETVDELKSRYGDCGVISIGAAGENRVRFAMTMVDKRSTLGRSGFGAVMGSKNLKAVMVKGSRGVRVADPRRFMNAVRKMYDEVTRKPIVRAFHDIGIHVGWKLSLMHNMNPGNWSKTKWDTLYGVEKLHQVKKDIKACSSCWMACRTSYQVREGEFAGLETETGHYLQHAVIAQRLDLADQAETLKITDVANRAGMCMCTLSSLIDWVTRLYEKGDITEKETGGLTLKRNLATYLELAEKIIRREGIGDTLAKGWFATSSMVGHDARTEYMEGFGIAKGTDSIYPARSAKLDPMRFTMGVTNPRGGHSAQGHSSTTTRLLPIQTIRLDAEAWATPPDALERIFTWTPYYGAFNTARLTSHIEDVYTLQCALGTCTQWTTVGLMNAAKLAEFYSAATGFETSPQELKQHAERAYNLYKVLNAREGFTRKDDTPPDTWFTPLMTPDGPEYLTDYHRLNRLAREDIEKLLDDYYDERGWDIEKGIPTKEKLQELGLGDLI